MACKLIQSCGKADDGGKHYEIDLKCGSHLLLVGTWKQANLSLYLTVFSSIIDKIYLEYYTVKVKQVHQIIQPNM